MLLLPKTQPNSILCVETIYDQPRHFDKLFRLWYEIQQLPEDCLDVTIDFHYCEFLGHNGVAFLGGLVHLIKARGGRVNFDWDTLPEKIRINLTKNGFLYDFGCSRESSQGQEGNSIPYRRDLQYDRIGITKYLEDKWLGKGWVNISSGLQQEIAGITSEIYLNAFEHSQSAIGVFSCGQHYPNVGVLQLTVIDFGIGIPTRVRSLPQNSGMATIQALEWAFIPGNSTRPNCVGGTGLNLLKDFVMKNHGNFMIFSNDGYTIIDDNGIRYENKSTNFSGTLVNISFRCDESYYCLASEVSQIQKPLF